MRSDEMKKYIREPLNAITHLIAAVLSVLGFLILLNALKYEFTLIKLISVMSFSIGLVGLYSASTIYHSWQGTKERIKELERIDHMWIYVLIAGSYTPICLVTLKGWVGTVLLCVVWSLTILGIVLMKVWFNAPRWISTMFYLLLGWTAIIVIYPLYKSFSMEAMLLLVLGGLAYSIGALFYGFKSKNMRVWVFGYHEIFHVFTMLGSLCHFSLIYKFVIL